MPKLIIIATPIGNLQDVSTNLLNTVNALDYIFCEDTRVTSKFLNLININKSIKLISYHKFNEQEKLTEVLGLINTHQCGLMSDAGYPGLNDPGYVLIRACHANQIEIDVIDGPSAINHAIVQSGMCSMGYMFIGFLMRKPSALKLLLDQYFEVNLPIVCFESVHRINSTLEWLKQHYPKLNIYIGRELTKKFETYFVGSINDVPFQVEKGEFTMVLSYTKTNNHVAIDMHIIKHELDAMLAVNIKLKDACKYLASKFNLSATELYNQMQNKPK